MTVKELIELLSKEDGDRLVVMSCDAEGNSKSPLEEFVTCAYKADSTYSGETGLEELTDELIDRGYSKEDVITDGIKALCFYPIN